MVVLVHVEPFPHNHCRHMCSPSLYSSRNCDCVTSTEKKIPPFEIAILCTNHGSRNYLLIYFSISNMIILGMLYKAKCDNILGLLAECELVLYLKKKNSKI